MAKRGVSNAKQLDKLEKEVVRSAYLGSFSQFSVEQNDRRVRNLKNNSKRVREERAGCEG